jgi:drug/metabolite transporter (DMT)-like permease
MTTAAFALVLASAVVHATWNFLVKRSGNKVAFFWAMGLVATGLLVVPAVAFALIDGFGWAALGFGIGTAALHAVYALSLTRGYHAGDLSTFYPVSRGMGPALVPVLAVIIFGESVSALAAAGIVLIVVGIYAVHIDQRFLSDLSHPLRALAAPEARIALFTGVVIACYTLWDKAGIDEDVPPVTLNGFSMAGNLLALTPAILWGADGRSLRSEWAAHRRSILACGVLAPLGYTLVLIAFTTSQVSYIAPAREVGIVLGAAMGVFLLGEGYGLTRVWGAALIVAGAITLGLAP